MVDLFDPSDFDTPPVASIEPEGDYRELLDAMSEAGVKGIRQETAPLLAAIQQDAARREEWQRNSRQGLSQFIQAAREMRDAADDLRRSRVYEWVIGAVIVVSVFALCLTAYQFFREPKVVQHYYGCTKWSEKAKDCKGRWIPLQMGEQS